MAEEKSSGNVVQSMVDSTYEILEALQRHVIAGLLLLPLWYFSFQSKFDKIDFQKPKWGFVVLIAALAVMIGNVWYAAHRFTVHFVVDNICFYSKCIWYCDYTDWLSRHLMKANNGSLESLRSYIKYRSSLINLVYITSEALLIFPFIAESTSMVHEYGPGLFFLGVILMFFASLQHMITFKIDEYVTNKAF